MKLFVAALFFSVLDTYVADSNQPFEPNVAQEHVSNGDIEELKAIQSSSAIFEEKNIIVNRTGYSFKLYASDEETDYTVPSMTIELDEVVAGCLRSSFNKYHNISEQELLSVQIETRDKFNIPALALQTYPNYFYYGWWGNIYWSMNCNMCNPDEPNLYLEGKESSESTEVSSVPGKADVDWEEHFCSCLVEEGEKGGSFGILSHAYDCNIQVSSPALEGNSRITSEHQAKITFTLQSNHIIDREERFITKTVEDLINSSKHLPESSAVVYSPIVDSMPGTSQVIYHDKEKRGGSFLRNTNTEEEYVFSIIATVVSSSSLLAILDDIDDKFCSMLASGPYSKLKSISDCKVEVAAPSVETATY